MTAWTLESCERLLDAADDSLRPGGLKLTQHLLGFGDFNAGSRILDAGCGMGATVRHLTRNLRLAAVGVDNSWSLINGARCQCPELPLVFATLEDLPFGEASFDGIVCECVLSQTNVGAALAEFRRVVRKGGRLLLSDIYRRSSCPDLAAQPAGHDQLATMEETVAVLGEAGFRIEHWEDRTRELRQLAIRLIMAPGPVDECTLGWIDGMGFLKDKELDMRGKDLGYHLLVARRLA